MGRKILEWFISKGQDICPNMAAAIQVSDDDFIMTRLQFRSSLLASDIEIAFLHVSSKGLGNL